MRRNGLTSDPPPRAKLFDDDDADDDDDRTVKSTAESMTSIRVL